MATDPFQLDPFWRQNPFPQFGGGGLLGQASDSPAPSFWDQDPNSLFSEPSSFDSSPEPYYASDDAPSLPTEPTRRLVEPVEKKEKKGIVTAEGTLKLVIPADDEETPPTSGLGALAKRNTFDQEQADKAAQGGPTIEVDPVKLAYWNRVNEVINSKKYWKASPAEMAHEAAVIARDEFGDMGLASETPFNFSKIADYRSRGGTRPSSVGGTGKQTKERTPDLVQVTRQHLAKGAASLRAGQNAALEAVQEAMGLDTSKTEARRQYYSAIAQALPDGTKLSDVHNLGDAVAWGYQQIVEQAPNLATSISGAGLGATVIRHSIGAKLGAFGTSYALELGQIEEGNKELDPESKASLATFLGAAPAAALDALLPQKIGTRLIDAFGEKTANEIALKALLMPDRQWLMQEAKRAGVELVTDAAMEGSTEGAQQVIEELTSSIQTGKPVEPGLVYRALEAAASGAVAGAGTGAVTSTIETAANRDAMTNAPLREMTDMPFVISADQAATNASSPSQRRGDIIGTPQLPSEARPMVLPAEERGKTTRKVLATQGPVDKEGKAQKLYVPQGPITSRFGPRHSFTTDNGQKASSNHAGVDIGLAQGTPVGAAADGVVIHAGKKGGYGNAVVIKFTDGSTVLYGHLSKIDVAVGDAVSQHDVIGAVGATGNATGPHLHFELRDAKGRPVNPLNGKVVKTGSTTHRDAEGKKVKSLTDDTGFATNNERVDYGEDAYTPPEEEDAAYTHHTGQQLVQPEEVRRAQARSDAVATATAILSTQREPIAENLAQSLDLAKQTNAANQALKKELRQTEQSQALADINPEAGSQQADALINASPPQGNPGEAPAPQTDLNSSGGQDFSQPLPGERPFYDEDLETVIGFMDQEGNVRALGEPPASTLPQQPAEIPEQPAPEQEQPHQPLVLPIGNEGDVGLSDLGNPNGQTPVATESSEENTGVKNRLVRPTYNFGADQTRLAYEVAPSPEQPVAERWRALPQEAKQVVTSKVNSFVLPKVLRSLQVSANPVGEIGGYQGESNPSLTLSTIVHTRAHDIAAALGHVLDQDSVFIVSERPGRGLEERGVLRISGVKNPAAVYDQLWSGDQRFSGYIVNGEDMLLANFSDASTEELANIADQLTGGQYDISAEKGYVDLITREEYNAGGETARSGLKGQELDRLRQETLLYRDQLIERAEQGGNPDGVREPEFDQSELSSPPVERGQITLDHFGPEGISETDPNLYGKNAQLFTPQERAYAANALPQTHFGIATGERGGYKQEFQGRTHYQAKVPADRLYDASKDPEGLWSSKDLDGSERKIKDAGYLGYWVKHPTMGMVAKAFEPVKVSPVKTKQQNAEIAAAKWADASAKVNATLREMALNNVRPDILTVQIVDAIAPVGFELPEGAAIAGQFDPARNLILVGTGVGIDPREIVRHELIHWARENLFTNTEWATLAKWARNDKNLMAWAKETYVHEGLSMDDLVEEAVAEGFARWKGGRLDQITHTPTGIVERALAKLNDLIQLIREVLGIAGITRGEIAQAAAILRSFEKGKLTKQRIVQRAEKQFGRKVYQIELSGALLAKEIDPAQYNFLRENPKLKEQIGWHGSGVADIDQFKLDFLGTGEGAQAFGWGLYFAQSKDVAEFYKDKLSGGRDPFHALAIDGVALAKFVQGTRINAFGGYEAMTDVASRIYDYMKANKLKTITREEMEELRANFMTEMEWHLWDAKEKGQQVREANLRDNYSWGIRAFDGLMGKHITMRGEGGLYQVHVPNNDKLLNLEEKLSEQPANIMGGLEKIREHLDYIEQLEHYEDHYGDFWNWTGKTLHLDILPQMAWKEEMPRNVSDELDNAVDVGDAAMASSIWLRDLGILGNRFLDAMSRGGKGDNYNFVVFDDSKIEIAAKYRIVDVQGINSPLSDPSIPNPSVARRLHNAVMAMLGAIGGKDVDTTDNLIDQWKRKLVNKYQAIINTQKRVAKQLGVDRLPEDINLYDMIAADERGYKLNYLADNYVKPMAKELAARGLTMEDLGLYLYARHAPARNARIARINKEFNTTTKPGSGMSNDEARQIMADFAAEGKDGDLAAVAAYIDQMIQFAQKERLDSGLLSQAQINAGFAPQDFYVPLRGNEELEPEVEMDFPLASRRGGGFSVPGKEGHRMYGRKTKAELEDIVGYVITQAQDAIDRGYRNRIGQTMLAMFEASPDPEFVKIDRVKRVPVWNKRKGIVEYQMQSRIADPEEEQRTVYVKVDGDTKKLTFNNQNPSAMRFARAAKNLGVSALPRVLQVWSSFTRLWSALNTSYNLEFLVRNAAKDAQTAVVNAQGVDVDVKGLSRSILKNILSLRPIYAALQGTMHDTGALRHSGSPWLATYHEFEENGGKLNYNQVDPLTEALKKAQKEIRQAQRKAGDPRKLASAVLTWIDHLNSAFENMTRLAAYKALRDRGIEAKAAAKVARELTTNFQQHGEWGPTINALYGFGNATLIGGARLTKTIATKPQIALGLIMVGFLSDLFGHLFDPDKWDQYSEDEKDSYMIFLLPEWAHQIVDADIKVPVGYGINSFITTGRKIAELMRGKKNDDGLKETVAGAAGDVATSFANSFAPVTGRSFFNWIAPSLIDPIVDIYQNSDNWGRPIMPTQPTRTEQQKPDSQLVFDRTGQFWRTLAQGANSLTGGNEVVPGAVDVSPETIKYVTGQLGGGAVRTTERIANAVAKTVTGKGGELAPNDIPFARAFLAKPYGAADKEGEQLSLFYDRMRDAQIKVGQAKEMIARFGKDSEEYKSFREDNKPLLNFYQTYEKAQKKLNALNAADNAAKRGAIRAEGLNRRDRNAIFKATQILVPQRTLKAEEVEKVRAKIKERKVKLAQRFNELYINDVMGEK